jgi:hypothetical protein
LVIRDVKTRETLCGLTEHAQGAVLQSNRHKNFEQALGAVVAEAQRIAGQVPRSPRRISPRFWFELLSECNPRQPDTGPSLRKVKTLPL